MNELTILPRNQRIRLPSTEAMFRGVVYDRVGWLWERGAKGRNQSEGQHGPAIGPGV